MNRFITVTINGAKNLISVDEIKAVGVYKPSGKTLLVLDLIRPDCAIEVDQTVDQIEEALCLVAIIGRAQDPIMFQRDQREREKHLKRLANS